MIRKFSKARLSVVFAVFLAMHVSLTVAQSHAAPGSRTAVAPDAAVEQPPQFGPNCAVCHGGDAQGTDRAPALTNNRRLRAGSETDIADTLKKGQGNMPSFNFLPPAQIQVLAHYVRSLNADAFDIKPAGDATAGASIFFGSGHCSDCHTAQGRGGTNGPDLSRIGRLLTVAELNQSIEDPAARISAGYGMVDVTLRDGSVLRGFARNRTTHSIDLQTFDGRLHLMLDAEYTKIFPDNPMASGMPTPMPPFGGTAEQRRDLIAFLSTLGGVTVGPNLTAHESVNPEAASAVLHPRPGDWPTWPPGTAPCTTTALSTCSPASIASRRAVLDSTSFDFI